MDSVYLSILDCKKLKLALATRSLLEKRLPSDIYHLSATDQTSTIFFKFFIFRVVKKYQHQTLQFYIRKNCQRLAQVIRGID